MKKLILLLTIVLLMPVRSWAEDYWVYIRMEDRPGITKSDDAGRSKRGDVVHIQKAVAGQEPTPREQQEYAIITVSDLKEKDLADLSAPFIDDEYVKSDPLEPDKNAAHRLQKVDVDALNLQKGFDPGNISDVDFKDKVSKKTKGDLARYEMQRQIYVKFIRPMIQIDNIIVRPAYAAQDISKICATGSNCTDEDYNSLATWEDTEDGDLDGENRQETAECYDDDGDLTANVDINGSTTSSTDYMEITCPVGERHDGTAFGGGCRINTSGNCTVSTNDLYTRVSWLILKGQTGGSFGHAAVCGDTTEGSSNYTVNNLVIDTPTENCFFFWVDAPMNIYANFCINPGQDGIYSNSASSSNFYDNTIWSAGGRGIEAFTGDCDNVAIFGSGTADFGACTGGSNRASSDTTGSAGLQSLTAADQFVDLTAGAEDLHLKAGADLISAGATPTPGAKNDIDNTSRPVDTYDIGADEYEAAAAPTPIRRSVLIF